MAIEEVRVLLGIGGIGISCIREHAWAENAQFGSLPGGVLYCEFDVCSATGREDHIPPVADIVPPEQLLVLRVPDIDIASRCSKLASDDPIRARIDVDSVSDLGSLADIGGNMRPAVLELALLLEPKWLGWAIAQLGAAIRHLAKLRGAVLGTVPVDSFRSTLGTVGSGGLLLLGAIRSGIRMPVFITDNVVLLADGNVQVTDPERARAITGAALDEVDRRARGLVLGPEPIFAPVGGIHMLLEAYSDEAALAGAASLEHLLARGKLTGEIIGAKTSRNNAKDKACASMSAAAAVLVPDSAALHARLLAKIAADAAQAPVKESSDLSVSSRVEALISRSLGSAVALVASISGSLNVRRISRQMVAELTRAFGRSADREMFARADRVLDEEEARASAESRVHSLTVEIKNAADASLLTSIAHSTSLFSTALRELAKYRDDLLRLKEARMRDSSACRVKINQMSGRAAAEAAQRAQPPRRSLWGFVRDALHEHDEDISASVLADTDQLRLQYLVLRGECQVIEAIAAALTRGLAVLRDYETDVLSLRDQMVSVAAAFRMEYERVGREAAERVRRFAGVSLAAEDQVIDALAASRMEGRVVTIASQAFGRLGAVEIGSVTTSMLDQAMRQEVATLLGNSHTYGLADIMDVLPDELLCGLAQALVPAGPPVLFDSSTEAQTVTSVAFVGHPRLEAAIRRTTPDGNRLTVHHTSDTEWFAITFSYVYPVKDLECYQRCHAAFRHAVEEGWAGQLVDRSVLELPDDGTDDASLQMIAAKAFLACSLQQSDGGRWYYVKPGCALSPKTLASAALHATFGAPLGSSVAEVIRTLRGNPALRRSLTTSWQEWSALRSPREILESIDSVFASCKHNSFSGPYSALREQCLAALRDNAYEEARGALETIGKSNGRSRERIDVIR